jgi:ABC-type dipeptide/oligopeptide/nickel transport system permease component
MEFSESTAHTLVLACYLALIAGMVLGVITAIKTDSD